MVENTKHAMGRDTLSTSTGCHDGRVCELGTFCLCFHAVMKELKLVQVRQNEDQLSHDKISGWYVEDISQ